MRIGILGGSFNPVHVGHLRLGIEVLERLGLARLDLVPCCVPPHKQTRGLLPFALRARSVALALGLEGQGRPEAGLCCNTLEEKRQGPSYTVDTLAAYMREAPHTQLHFILGAGDLLTLPSWKNGLQLPDLTSLVVVPRQQTDLDAVAAFVAENWPGATRKTTPAPDMLDATAIWSFPSGTNLLYLPLPRLDVSSTLVRELWRQGRSLRGLVPELVLGFLEAERAVVDAIWKEEERESRS